MPTRFRGRDDASVALREILRKLRMTGFRSGQASSGAARSAKARLATASSTNGHRRSPLQLRRVSGQVGDVDALGHRRALRRVPAGAVDDQHRAARRPDPLVAGELRRRRRRRPRADDREQAPPTLAGARPDEAEDVEPLVPPLPRGRSGAARAGPRPGAPPAAARAGARPPPRPSPRRRGGRPSPRRRPRRAPAFERRLGLGVGAGLGGAGALGGDPEPTVRFVNQSASADFCW